MSPRSTFDERRELSDAAKVPAAFDRSNDFQSVDQRPNSSGRVAPQRTGSENPQNAVDDRPAIPREPTHRFRGREQIRDHFPSLIREPMSNHSGSLYPMVYHDIGFNGPRKRISGQRQVRRRFRRQLRGGDFDLDQRLTPLTPTYLRTLATACSIQFVVGPWKGNLCWSSGTRAGRRRPLCGFGSWSNGGDSARQEG